MVSESRLPQVLKILLLSSVLYFSGKEKTIKGNPEKYIG